jgi:hypothetical protein
VATLFALLGSLMTQTVTKGTRPVRFCVVAIKRWCAYCNEPMPWNKRSDAIYCKPSCRQAAHHASHLNPEIADKTQVTSPPFDYCPIDMDVWEITWSSATRCDSCHRFVTTGVGMLYFGSIQGVFGCSWECLRTLTEDVELEAEF